MVPKRPEDRWRDLEAGLGQLQKHVQEQAQQQRQQAENQKQLIAMLAGVLGLALPLIP